MYIYIGVNPLIFLCFLQVIMELNCERWFVPVTDSSIQSTAKLLFILMFYLDKGTRRGNDVCFLGFPNSKTGDYGAQRRAPSRPLMRCIYISVIVATVGTPSRQSVTD